MFFSFLVAN